MVSLSKRETDVWEVRCYYRHSDIPERIAQGELTRFLVRRHPAGKKNKQVPGTMTEIFGWKDPATNEQVAETCQYTRPDGTLGGSGELDPKKVLVSGVLVVAYEGKERVKRDLVAILPEAPFGRCWAARLYGWYRKKCCRELGPEGDAVLAAKRTPQIVRVLNFLRLSST